MRRPWLLLFLPFLVGQSHAPQRGSVPQNAARSRQGRLLEILMAWRGKIPSTATG